MSKKVITMNEMETANHHETDHAAPETGASVDKIRDILFGSHLKNYEARFARLEENLVRETVELKETMRRRFESLEEFFRSETTALSARLKAEREERTDGARSLDRDLKAAHEELGRRIHELDAATSEAQSSLRRELMAESRKLLDEISQRHDTLRSLLERRAGELRHQKADRTLLAGLLTGIANQIAEDHQPGQEAGESQ